MGKILDTDPAAFTLNDSLDDETIKTIGYILDSRIKGHIASGDKFPNIDGILTITNKTGVPLGQLQVQVKKLKEENLVIPKHQCKVKFLSYCHRCSIPPVILIVVDNKNACAYWRLMNKSLIMELDSKIGNQDSINVDFDIMQKISKDEKKYVDSWTEIVERLTQFVSESEFKIDQMTQELESIKMITGERENNENVTKEIHYFLDYLNHWWDYDFARLKESLYPQVWKFGLGYQTFTHFSASLVLYPISYSENIVSVKFVRSLASLNMNNFFKAFDFMNENPVLKRPSHFALELIQKDALKFLKERRLISFNKTLVKEYILSFISRYSYLMGLIEANNYSVEGVIKAISETLFQNAHKILRRHGEFATGNYFNIDFALSLTKTEIDICLSTEYKKVPNVVIGSKTFSIPHIQNLLTYLLRIDDHTLDNIYPPRTLAKIDKINILEPLNEKEMKNIIKSCFLHLAQAYDDFIYDYFPRLIEELKIFKNYDLLVVIQDPNKPNTVYRYTFKTEGNRPENRIIVLDKKDWNYFDYLKFRQQLEDGIEIEGKVRKLYDYSWEELQLKTSGTPLLELVNKMVIDKLEHYFKKELKKLDTR